MSIGAMVSSLGNVMIRTCLCTTRPDATIIDAAEKMSEQGSSGLVVFDGVPVGLVTADHLIHALANSDSPHTVKVAEIMVPSPIPTVKINSSLANVLTTMVLHHVQAAAVRDGEELVGVVSLRQVLPHLAAMVNQVVSVQTT